MSQPSWGTLKLREVPPWIGPPVSRVSIRRQGDTDGTNWNGPVTSKLLGVYRLLPEAATSTFPELAPKGTVAVISEDETTLKVEGVPLNRTLLAPVRFDPR